MRFMLTRGEICLSLPQLFGGGPVHGHACSVRGFTSWPWRRTGLRHRRAYREFVMKENPKTVQRFLRFAGAQRNKPATRCSVWMPNRNNRPFAIDLLGYRFHLKLS